MIGWHITVFTVRNQAWARTRLGAAEGSSESRELAPPGVVPAKWEPGDRIAVWRTGINGLRWLDDLARAGQAIQLLRDGYPCTYLVRAAPAKEHLVRDGRLAPSVGDQTASDPEELLLVEAWDES